MRISHIRLENWKNFRKVDVDLSSRVFLVGPNASGKSNFLDVFRFLRDLASDGFQKAVKERRGGVSKIRCLAARRYPDILINVSITEKDKKWTYELVFSQDNNRRPIVKEEKVLHNEETVLSRPNKEDESDEARKYQTHLEQIIANKEFRELVNFFKTVSYRHLVPQIIRNPQDYQMTRIEQDPFGRDFLERLSATTERTRKSRLIKIVQALNVAVPQLDNLEMEKDDRGIPHLLGKYNHWRADGAKQREDQFSDGTLRLVGLLWSLLEGDGPLLLEEPELSLHSGIVKRLAPMIHRMQKKKSGTRQVILSTHSSELLSDRGIGGEEVLLLIPSREGTEVKVASTIEEIKVLLDSGMTIAEVAIPKTEPKNLQTLDLFK